MCEFPHYFQIPKDDAVPWILMQFLHILITLLVILLNVIYNVTHLLKPNNYDYFMNSAYESTVF